jgi:ribosome-associated protein
MEIKNPEQLCESIETFLDGRKAEDIVRIDLRGKSAIADYMVIANGTSHRHVSSMSELLKEHLHKNGVMPIFVEGKGDCDWILIDAGDVIVHLFRPEVREFYNLEKMWGIDIADFARKAKTNED